MPSQIIKEPTERTKMMISGLLWKRRPPSNRSFRHRTLTSRPAPSALKNSNLNRTISGTRRHFLDFLKKKKFACLSVIWIIDLSLYRRHVRQHMDTKEDKRSCPTCLYTNKDEKDVMRHFMNVHAMLYEWQCRTCSRFFWVKRDYERHLRNHSQFPALINETVNIMWAEIR